MKMCGDVDSIGVPDNVGTQPGFMNVVSGRSMVSVDEVLYVNNSTENGWRLMFGPARKSMTLLWSLLQKFSKPCDLVSYLFGGALSLSKVCLFWKSIRELWDVKRMEVVWRT